MAPAEEPIDSFYLPSLDKCLHGEHRLISWQKAHDALLNPSLAKSSPNLPLFLQDEQCINLLSSDLGPQLPATTQTKTDFETRTASINVTPSQDGTFDIQQIKDDTLWLSKHTKVDEVTALRTVILEWQDRSASKILEGYTEEESISVQQLVADNSFGASQLARSTTLSANERESQNTFDSTEARHARLLRIYLSESDCLLAVSCVLGVAASAKPAGKQISAGTQSRLDGVAWIDEIVEKLSVASQGKAKPTNPEKRLQVAVEYLTTAVQGWESGADWAAEVDDGPALDALYRTSKLTQILLGLKLVCVHAAGLQSWSSAANVQAWFEFVDKVVFFEGLQAQVPNQQPLIEPIQALTSVISLQLLRLPYVLDHIQEHSPHGRPIPFIYDEACREQVNSTLANAASRASRIASPALLAWSIILQYMRLRVQPADDDDDASLTDGSSPAPARKQPSADAPTGFTTALDAILQASFDGDPIGFYAKAAVDGASVLAVTARLSKALEPVLTVARISTAAVQVSLALLELLRQALDFLAYSSDLVDAFLELLSDSASDPVAGSRVSPVRATLAQTFLHNRDALVPKILNQAQTRYPFEIIPLLKLGQALTIPMDQRPTTAAEAPLVLEEYTPYFTARLPKGFDAYDTTREDENANMIVLKQDIPLFIPRRYYGLSKASQTREVAIRDDDDAALYMRIPAGTIGTVISDDRPYLVQWDYRHSALQYLACLLASATPSSRYKDAANNVTVDLDVQADIIGLIARLVEARLDPDSGADDAKEFLLEDASEYLGRNGDIISVVFDIFEEHLARNLDRSDASVSLVVSCIDFFRVILPVLPGRVWPILARSELLGVERNGGRLSTVIASAESIASRVRIIEACLDLTEALTKDIVTHSALAKSESRAIAKRFKDADDRSSGLLQRVTSKIMVLLTHSLLSIFEGTQSWPLEATVACHNVRLSITNFFNDIVVRAYATVMDSDEKGSSLFGALIASAKLIIEAFLEASAGDVLIGKLWSTFAAVTPCDQSFASSPRHNPSTILTFLLSLLSYSKQSDTPALPLARALFQALPLIARSYVSSDDHKESLLLLLSAIVREAGASEKEPPSLLGHLGSEAAKAFLVNLQQFNRPLGKEDVAVEIWKLAADVVSNKQQWVTTFLITGKIPKRSSGDRKIEHDQQKSTGRKDKAVFTMALDLLAKRAEFHDPCSIAMLRFVVETQNHNPWVSSRISQHKAFCTRILDYVSDMRTSLSRDELEQAQQTHAAARVADVLAMYVYNMRQFGSLDDLDNMSSKLGFYRENGVALPDYNASLHVNLKRNIEKRFTGCSLESFKRTSSASEFGESYHYDLEFAGKVLGKQPAWHGSKGFKAELIRANLNLSLVEAQVLLMRSWESLVTELSQSLAGRDGLQKQMINIVNHCLTNNVKSSNHDEKIFEHLMQRRADLALVILQRLTNVRCKASSFKTLLPAAWDMVRTSIPDFETAFTFPTNTEYSRTTLQVLLLILQPHTYIDPSTPGKGGASPSSQTRPTTPPDTLSTLLEIITSAVCAGFRCLCTQLHTAPSTVDPADLALLIALLQTVLRVPCISTSHSTLSIRIADTGVHRYALALFSWSDRLLTSTSTPPNSTSISSSRNENSAANTLEALTLSDLALSLLHTASAIPPFAEFLGTEGILSQLAATPLLSHLRSPSPSQSASSSSASSTLPTTATSPEMLRLQTIFSRTLLPLVLNLLTAIGGAFAAEAVAFLSGFSAQLARASASFSTASRVGPRNDPLAGVFTLGMAREVHTLALISLAVRRAVDSPGGFAGGMEGLREVSAGAWDEAKVKEGCEAFLGGRREELRGRLRAGSEWEEGLMGQGAKNSRPSGGGGGEGTNGEGNGEACDNALEEAVVGELRGCLRALGGE